MPRLLLAALPFAILLTAHGARAADFYVAPDGVGNTCSLAAPCGRVEDAQSRAAPGDTVWIRGGVYTFSANATVGVNFNKSGSAGKPIRYFAYAGEQPVFDLANGTPNGRVTGLNVQCNWIHVRGLEVRGVQQYMSGQDSWGVRIQGSDNVIERVEAHHNEAPGIFITSGANNLILNCDSHHNYDVLEQGGSGDGFGCHSTGSGNVLRGCRAYANSDDGYDFIRAPGACTVERSFAFNNGYVPDTMTAAGNGAGFKAGGFGSPPTDVPNPVPRHVVRQCVAFGNRSQGFYANHHPGGLDLFNNIAFKNSTNYNMLTDTESDHKLRNNIALAPGTAISQLKGGTDKFNSWTLSLSVSSADFLSVMESEALAPRQADGSLPEVNFLRLAKSSDLIDKGEDVGLPFAGSAPDLGPFESGLAAQDGGASGGNSGDAGPGASDAAVQGSMRDAATSRDSGASGSLPRDEAGVDGARDAASDEVGERDASSDEEDVGDASQRPVRDDRGADGCHLGIRSAHVRPPLLAALAALSLLRARRRMRHPRDPQG